MILAALLLQAVTPTIPAPTPALAARSDEQWASEGPYVAFASPWCRWVDRTLQPGRDYANAISWERGSLPVAQITWRWPEASRRKCGVYGYDFIAWGNYDGGATMQPVPPRQVGAIGDLTFSYGVDVAAPVDGYNGLAEFFLTREPGRADLKAVEVGFLWHAPAATQAWARSGRQIGEFTDRYDRRWTVAVSPGGVSGTYVTFIPPGGEQPWGRLDASGALAFLRAAGIVDPAWWLNGAAIGIEPLGGFGTAIVRQWAVR